MAIFPPAAAVTLTLDGRQLRSYTPLYLARGRVLGPIEPFLTRVAERIEYRGNDIVFVRAGHDVRVHLLRREPLVWRQTYVALAPALRALGDRVRFDAARRVLEVTSGVPRAIRPTAPFNPRTPQVRPSVVFTPLPIPTPRPVWRGTPRPRRTPIPLRAWATPKP